MQKVTCKRKSHVTLCLDLETQYNIPLNVERCTKITKFSALFLHPSPACVGVYQPLLGLPLQHVRTFLTPGSWDSSSLASFSNMLTCRESRILRRDREGAAGRLMLDSRGRLARLAGEQHSWHAACLGARHLSWGWGAVRVTMFRRIRNRRDVSWFWTYTYICTDYRHY